MDLKPEDKQMVVAQAAAALAVPNPNALPLYPEAAEWAIMKEMAVFVESSGLLPKNIQGMKNPVAAATTIMLQGRELGVSMMQALSDIYVVNGRPSCGTDLMMAMVARQGAGYIVTVQENWDGPKPTSFITRRAVRPGRPDEEFTYTWADAIQGSLSEKDTFKKYPRQLMEHRCTSILARRMWPDIIRGMYTPDEAEEIGATPADYIEVSPHEDAVDAVVEPAPVLLGEEGVKAFNEAARSLVAGYPALQATLAKDVKGYVKKEFGADKIADVPVFGLPRIMEFIGLLVRSAAEGGVVVNPAENEIGAKIGPAPSAQELAEEASLPDESAMREEFYRLAGDTTESHRAWGKLEGPDQQLAALVALQAAAGQEGMSFDE
jgi:hypothetical protein